MTKSFPHQHLQRRPLNPCRFLEVGTLQPPQGWMSTRLRWPLQSAFMPFHIYLVFLIVCRLDTVTDFFNRMVQSVNMNAFSFSWLIPSTFHRSCHTKCIGARYADADLNKGESVCIDRCVAKFNEVQKKVGEKLQSRGAANAASGATGGFGSL